MRLRLVMPLVEGVERRGRNASSVLATFNLTRDLVAGSETFVSAPTMYALVEALAETSGDPYFGVHEGERLDPWGWSPLAGAAASATTVGDFLLRFSIAASEDASSVTFGLETVGSRSTFSERRMTSSGLLPRHNDGFSIAYVLAILRTAVGESWDGSRVLASVCDPAVVPPDYFGIRLAATDTLGFRLAFPSEWLLLTPQLGEHVKSNGAERETELPAGSAVAALRQALTPHLHEHDLDTERIASLFGLSKRSLARRLQAQGTTVSTELSALRRERAERDLRRTDLSVAEIGARVGYPDAAVFSRAFRRWTGMSPSEFRHRLTRP